MKINMTINLQALCVSSLPPSPPPPFALEIPPLPLPPYPKKLSLLQSSTFQNYRSYPKKSFNLLDKNFPFQAPKAHGVQAPLNVSSPKLAKMSMAMCVL